MPTLYCWRHELPRATQANWMLACGELIEPLINLLNEHLLAQPLISLETWRLVEL